jgi:hypothetical protein
MLAPSGTFCHGAEAEETTQIQTIVMLCLASILLDI